MSERRWAVGELARATGLTVRTLHHYDQIGLVRPSERTHAGHRRYTEADIRRLYRVRALRSIGVGLDAIAETLAQGDRETLQSVLTDQLAHLDAQVRRMSDLRTQVRGLLERMNTDAEPGEVLAILEAMKMIESYYTPDQLDYLAKRREELGEDAIKEVEQEWPRLIAAMSAHHTAGTPVGDPEVQALTERWFGLVEAFTGGDAGVRESMGKLWAEQGDTINQQFDTGITPGLMEYVYRANAVRTQP
ncbi:MerR family transcriptional regulatory protein [Alloactinosynnema sp. L-07]|uniref:MerR family transcriptional regulator n=1 Tax=Alloactinosynnema sp. L-07 TaxID=1653480 RepID=UPI00065EFEEA|nr:MerR family transcriptional regulator [Alloactinosynnema sp. L-07]CRK60682.1 MerR family transcriptional regulatory protein [Alloactinosynnema sp. L-07]